MDPVWSRPWTWPPPEFAPAQSDGTWRSPGYRPSRTRSRVVLVLLGLTVAADAIGAMQALAGFGLIDAASSGALTDADAGAYDTMVMVTGFVQAGLFYAAGIAILAWLSRVVEAVPPLTGFTPRRSPREAIGWWFVPFASYVVPFQIVRDTMTRLRTSPDRGAERFLWPWWTLWVIVQLSNIWVLRAGADPQTLDDIRVMFAVRLLSDGIEIASGVFLLLIVRGVERRAELRAAALGLGRSGVPAWPAASYPEQDPVPRVTPELMPSAGFGERIAVSADGPAEPPPPPG